MLVPKYKQWQNGQREFSLRVLTRQALDVGATHEVLGGGGHKVAALYFSCNISAAHKCRNAKPGTQPPENLAEVICKFSANPISDDVTVTSEVK